MIMDIDEIINNKDYLYKLEGSKVHFGKQYNESKSKFIDFADNTLFTMLLTEYIRKYKDNVKEVKIDKDSTTTVLFEIEKDWDVEFMDYVEDIFKKFFLTRVIKENNKLEE